MNKYNVGNTVRLLVVDRYGFNGRDFHPFAGVDEGFTGVVVKVDREEEGYGEEPVAPEDEIYCYRVCRPSDGRVLDLMEHELG